METPIRRKRSNGRSERKDNSVILKRILLSVAALAVIICLIFLVGRLNRRDDDNYISRALASRMLVLLKTDVPSDGSRASEWYVKYMDFLYDNGEISWNSTQDYSSAEYGYGALCYEELREYLAANKWDVKQLEEYTGIHVASVKGTKRVKRSDFEKIYDYMIVKTGSAGGVTRRELTIVGTPSNMTTMQIRDYGQWNCVALEGVYCFEGLSIDAYSDRTICVYARNNQILSVLTVVSEEVQYPNIWILSGSGNTLEAYISGVYRKFEVAEIEGTITDVIGDIYMKEGAVNRIVAKQDTINGKVLKINESTVELEGYGNVSLAENFRVYTNYGELEETDINDILVGYDVSDFVVADGRICAAVINKELVADDIRVLIMDMNHETIFHDRVTLTSEDGFTITKGENVMTVEPGELVDIYAESDYMSEGRITLEPVGLNNTITILSIERSYGNPYYSGTLEIAVEQGKLVVINELPLEEYLYHVVPSEMPVKFGVEALKVQAVCARSYAYRHLLDNSYRMYGAHVDDSVNYQVYNNIEAQPDSTQAVKETYGQVLQKYGEVVSAYYYSTSCGSMSDISLWGGDSQKHDMYQAKSVNPEGRRLDLSSEESFIEFINSRNENDYDFEFPFYRWSVEMDIDYLSERVNEYLPQRYAYEQGSILTKNEAGEYSSAEEPYVGRILNIEVVERTTGGAVRQLLIQGTDGDVLVIGELNIRYLLGPGDNLITTNTDSQTTFYILPSSYIYLEAINEDGGLAGYSVVGGGYGHGIGMSQNAVSAMVKRGMRYDDIIEFFYEGVDIVNIYHGGSASE